MAKLILLSVLLFASFVPIVMSRHSRPERAIRTIHVLMVMMTFVWAYACRTYYPELVLLSKEIADE